MGRLLFLFSHNLQVACLHQPAERTGVGISGRVPASHEDIVHVVLLELGHVGQGGDYLVSGDDGHARTVLGRRHISPEEVCDEDEVCVHGR